MFDEELTRAERREQRRIAKNRKKKANKVYRMARAKGASPEEARARRREFIATRGGFRK